MHQFSSPSGSEERIISDYVALIIAYKNHSLLTSVLTKLANQTVTPAVVLVVDNGGTLTEADLCSAPLADRLELISLPDNPGYGAAVNQARERIDERTLLVLTHDAEFDQFLAEKLLDTLAKNPAAGSVAPQLRLVSRPEHVFSAGGKLNTGGLATHHDDILSDEAYTVDWLDGAIVMFRPAALADIGWIAEEYFLYFEDVDTGWRLKQAGWQSLVEPGAIAYQEPGAHPVYLGMRNMTLFARKSNIALLPHLSAVSYRATRETLSRLKHQKPLQLGSIVRGWRDGRKGLNGKPPQ